PRERRGVRARLAMLKRSRWGATSMGKYASRWSCSTTLRASAASITPSTVWPRRSAALYAKNGTPPPFRRAERAWIIPLTTDSAPGRSGPSRFAGSPAPVRRSGPIFRVRLGRGFGEGRGWGGTQTRRSVKAGRPRPRRRGGLAVFLLRHPEDLLDGSDTCARLRPAVVAQRDHTALDG